MEKFLIRKPRKDAVVVKTNPISTSPRPTPPPSRCDEADADPTVDVGLRRENPGLSTANHDHVVTVQAEELHGDEPPKKRARIFRFAESWRLNRPWLTYDTSTKLMKCSYCISYNPHSKTKFITGCESLRLDNVRSHEISDDHKKSHSVFLNSQKPHKDQPIVKALLKLQKHELETLKKLFRTAFYVGKQERPYTDYTSLNKLQATNFSDNTITHNYNNDKQARTFIRYIAQSQFEELLKAVNSSEFVSVAIDGSTDSSNLEQELFYISYLDENFVPKTDFFIIKDVDGRASSQNLADILLEVFSSHGVDLRQKCIQVATDGPSVMRKMCEILRYHMPWLLTFHCSNHRLELAFKDAVKGNSIYQEVQSLLENLHSFYSNSSLQSRLLKATAEQLGIRSIVHPTTHGTRWVAHREKAVLAADRNFAANCAQLLECSKDATQRQETRSKALGLKEKLVDEDVVLFLFAIFKFLLSTFACLSCLLQNSSLSIDTLVSTIETTKRKLKNFDAETAISNFKIANIKDGIFRDVQLKSKRNGSRSNSTETLITQSNSLVQNLQEAIVERFGPLSDGNIGTCPIISQFVVFDISNLPDDVNDDITNYGVEEIDQLTNHFKGLLELMGYDADKIQDERVPLWQFGRNILKTTKAEGRGIMKFWPKVLRRKSNSNDLRNILALVKMLLTLTFSTACVERGFSLMRRVKSDWRSSLKSDSLCDLMRISLSKETIENFDPKQAIELWYLDSKSKRRFVDNYGPRRTCTSPADSEKLFDLTDSEFSDSE